MEYQTEIIKNVKQNVLDQEHNRFMYLRRDQENGIIWLLKKFNDLVYAEAKTPPDSTYQGLVQKRDLSRIQIKALDYCLKWLLQRPPSQFLLLDAAGEQLLKERVEFFSWGETYARLVTDHAVLNKRAINATVDESTKTITFIYPSRLETSFWQTQVISEETYYDFGNYEPMLEILHERFLIWDKQYVIGQVTSQATHNETPWELENDPIAHQAVIRWLDEKTWPSISSSTDLGGYTLSDFRRVFAALFVQGVYCSWKERLSGNSDTIIIRYPEIEMTQWLSRISGVSLASTRAILDDFTFDVFDDNSSTSFQPFVKSRQGNMFLAASRVTRLDPEHMLSLTLINKRPETYDSKISTPLEKNDLVAIEKELNNSMIADEILRDKPLRNNKGEEIKPDFLLISRGTQEVLVIEYKRVLPPFNTVKVISKSRELNTKKLVGKVQKYCSFLKENHASLPNWINEDTSIQGMLLFKWPMPLPEQPDEKILTIDWLSLSRNLDPSNKLTISELIHWVRTRPDLSVQLTTLNFFAPPIKVGEWTYTFRLEQRSQVVDLGKHHYD